jgi:hypothetical protein
MTIVTPTGITGINSITSLVDDITFSTASGSSLTANGLSFTNLQTSSINDGPLAGARNRIINGDMQIAQRGTSFAASNGYGLDRWIFGPLGEMVCTVSQSSDVPNDTFQNSIKVDVTTADTSIAAGQVTQLIQYIEGYNVRDLIGTTFTLSFWVKSPKTGVHCVAFRNINAAGAPPDRSHIKQYTVVAANTWEYKTLTVTGGLITAGTWNWTNGIGLSVTFTLACGTTFQTTADAWQTGNFIATANQVNVMDNTANDFFLTGVQLEPGTVATPFERRSYTTELQLCQRYYFKTYNTGITPGTITTAGLCLFLNNSSGSGAGNVIFPVEMRAVPTCTAYNSITGGTGSWYDTTSRTVFIDGTGTRQTYVALAELGGAGAAVAGHLVASAEL